MGRRAEGWMMEEERLSVMGGVVGYEGELVWVDGDWWKV